jgi:hypothetical protein
VLKNYKFFTFSIVIFTFNFTDVDIFNFEYREKCQFVVICLNFQQKNSFKIQYLPHLKYENYEINSSKSNSTITFQQHQVHLWIQINFLFLILLMFIKKMVQ